MSCLPSFSRYRTWKTTWSWVEWPGQSVVVMWCDVMWCEVMWCDVMWCDVMWCDVVWCDVICCDVIIWLSFIMYVFKVCTTFTIIIINTILIPFHSRYSGPVHYYWHICEGYKGTVGCPAGKGNMLIKYANYGRTVVGKPGCWIGLFTNCISKTSFKIVGLRILLDVMWCGVMWRDMCDMM